MNVICALEHPSQPPKTSIFLAGPSPRGNGEYDWRKEALSLLLQLGFTGTVYVPLPRDGVYKTDFDHAEQIDWELKYLGACQIIAFWIPRDLETLPGFTTNVEFGLFVRSGKVVLGYPKGAPKMKYLHHLANKNGVVVSHSLKETLEISIRLAA